MGARLEDRQAAEVEAWCAWVDALVLRDDSLAAEAEQRLRGRESG